MRTAHISIVITIIFWACTSIPNIFLYRVVGGVCRQTSPTYNTYAIWFINPVLYCALPVGVLAVFGYGAYNNIRRVTHRQGQSRKKIDEQLTRALILQCCSFTLSQVRHRIDPFARSTLVHLGSLCDLESLRHLSQLSRQTVVSA